MTCPNTILIPSLSLCVCVGWGWGGQAFPPLVAMRPPCERCLFFLKGMFGRGKLICIGFTHSHTLRSCSGSVVTHLRGHAAQRQSGENKNLLSRCWTETQGNRSMYCIELHNGETLDTSPPTLCLHKKHVPFYWF